MNVDVWYRLLDSASGKPHMGTDADIITVPQGTYVANFRKLVAKENSITLSNVDPAQLFVYKNIETFNKRNLSSLDLGGEESLKAFAKIDGLGNPDGGELIVAVPSSSESSSPLPSSSSLSAPPLPSQLSTQDDLSTPTKKKIVRRKKTEIICTDDDREKAKSHPKWKKWLELEDGQKLTLEERKEGDRYLTKGMDGEEDKLVIFITQQRTSGRKSSQNLSIKRAEAKAKATREDKAKKSKYYKRFQNALPGEIMPYVGKNYRKGDTKAEQKLIYAIVNVQMKNERCREKRKSRMKKGDTDVAVNDDAQLAEEIEDDSNFHSSTDKMNTSEKDKNVEAVQTEKEGTGKEINTDIIIEEGDGVIQMETVVDDNNSPTSNGIIENGTINDDKRRQQRKEKDNVVELLDSDSEDGEDDAVEIIDTAPKRRRRG